MISYRDLRTVFDSNNQINLLDFMLSRLDKSPLEAIKLYTKDRYYHEVCDILNIVEPQFEDASKLNLEDIEDPIDVTEYYVAFKRYLPEFLYYIRYAVKEDFIHQYGFKTTTHIYLLIYSLLKRNLRNGNEK